MRNLQKILALALALIMSFSLVVTANAAFSDEADITDTYNEAVNVLSQLEVFKGYTDGTYQPQKSITRAEVAAIIYRIATGDVTDTQVSIYSDWNRFTDVHAGEWWAGYINYCANAEYIKGYGNGKFGPDDPVTGYEALAMILRAVGYGKMDGEFQGSDWAVQTAARANTLKVTKNVQNSALLNSAATRELVAELLFRSILVPTVEYNQFSGYTENDTALAYQSFGLEAIEGVVVANEYANLYDTEVLADNKTDLEEADGTVRHLDIGSALTDVGESRYAYIIDDARGAKVLALEDTGINNVFDNTTGEDRDISTTKKFKDVSGIDWNDVDEGTEFYVNFGRVGHYSCDQRLEFEVIFYTKAAFDSFATNYEKIAAYAYERNTDNSTKDDDWTVKTGTWTETDGSITLNKTEANPSSSNGAYTWPTGTNSYIRFNRIIRAEENITNEEMNILEGIFAAADEIALNGQPKDMLSGDVYVGTKSNEKDTKEERDLSNTISFRKFQDEYINAEAWDRNFGDTENGEWLKIVDNDNDGKAEYAFKTEYFLDQVVRVSTKNDETKYQYRYLDVDDDDITVKYLTEEKLEVGSKVLYSLIDGKALIELPKVVTDTITSMSFKDETVTTKGGETYGQSGIYNKTDLEEIITNMDEDVRYNMYLDKYGFVRAYELADGTQYALLTELYPGSYRNGRYVKDTDLTVELKAGDEKIDEFNVLNNSDNDFDMRHVAGWASNINDWTDLGSYDSDYPLYGEVYQGVNVVLQPATAHLSLRTENGSAMFNPAVTNIAKYVKTDDGVRINSAAKFAINTKGDELWYVSADETEKMSKSEWVDDQVEKGSYTTATAAGAAFDEKVADGTFQHVYSMDYVQLQDGVDVKENQWKWLTKADASEEVYAVHDTEFYVVERAANSSNDRILHFVDYENVPEILNSESDIRAVYALAENTTANRAEKDYWVAEVIVIEVGEYVGGYDSVSLFTRNPSQTSGDTKRMETLNNESSDPRIDVVPASYDWGREITDTRLGFYELRDTKTNEDGSLTADSVRQIDSLYNDHGIYAGIVKSMNRVNSRGGYIVVDFTDGSGSKAASTEKVYTYDVPVYAVDGKTIKDITLDDEAQYSDVQVGDRIIWVENAKDKEAYIVDVTSHDEHVEWTTPSWLYDGSTAIDSEWEKIWHEQNNPATVSKTEASFYGVKDTNGDFVITVPYQDAADFVAEHGDHAENVLTGDVTQVNKTISLKKGGDTYTAVINGKAYTLNQSAAGSAGALALIDSTDSSEKYLTTGGVLNNGSNSTANNINQMTVEAYATLFKVTGDYAKVLWHFTKNVDGRTYDYEATVASNGNITGLKSLNGGSVDASITDMKTWSVEIQGEDGTVKRYGNNGALATYERAITTPGSVVATTPATNGIVGETVAFKVTGQKLDGYFAVTSNGKTEKIPSKIVGSDTVNDDIYVMPDAAISVTFVERSYVNMTATGATVSTGATGYTHDWYVNEDGVVTFDVTVSAAGKVPYVASQSNGTKVTGPVLKSGNVYTFTVTVDEVYGKSYTVSVGERNAAAESYIVAAAYAAEDDKIVSVTPDEQDVYAGEDAVFTVTVNSKKTGLTASAVTEDGDKVPVTVTEDGTTYTVTVAGVTADTIVTLVATADGTTGEDVSKDDSEVKDDIVDSDWGNDADKIVKIISGGLRYVRTSANNVRIVVDDPSELIVFQVVLAEGADGADDVTLMIDGEPIDEATQEAIIAWHYANDPSRPTSISMEAAVEALGGFGYVENAGAVVLVHVPAVDGGENIMLTVRDISNSSWTDSTTTVDLRNLTKALATIVASFGA